MINFKEGLTTKDVTYNVEGLEIPDKKLVLGTHTYERLLVY